MHTYMLNIHARIHAWVLPEALTYIHAQHTYIHTYMLGGPCLDRPPEAQEIKFRPGSPECFKTLTETQVWTHFLVQAGYLDFWASEASDAEQH